MIPSVLFAIKYVYWVKVTLERLPTGVVAVFCLLSPMKYLHLSRYGVISIDFLIFLKVK